MACKPLGLREKKLLRRIAWGRSDAVISRQIGGTEIQIAAQRARLLAKINIGSEDELAAVAEKLWRSPSGLQPLLRQRKAVSR